MCVSIFQGRTAPLTAANITIVIDVIRAFTVAHYAFLQGVSRIYLAETVEQAFAIKRDNPEYLLAGEVKGIPIDGFDLGNSPHQIQAENLAGKTLVQKTTNGVRATLNCLNAEHVFVTGFTNARETAEFVSKQIDGEQSIHIIASHPSGDDDLACAEYIKAIVEDTNSISAEEVAERIIHSHAAEKFFDEDNSDFLREDILNCIDEINKDFVMKINKNIPMIERVSV